MAEKRKSCYNRAAKTTSLILTYESLLSYNFNPFHDSTAVYRVYEHGCHI
jgi:hypothetical protein